MGSSGRLYSVTSDRLARNKIDSCSMKVCGKMSVNIICSETIFCVGDIFKDEGTT